MAGLASAWINIFRIDSLLQKERAKTQNGRRSLTKIKIWPGARPGLGFIRAPTCHLILIVHDLGAHDAVIGLRIDVEIDRTAVAKLATDDGSSAVPAALVGEQRMIDDDPTFVIGKVDGSPVFIPAPPPLGTDQADSLEPATPTPE